MKFTIWEFRLAGCTSKMVLAELSTSCVKIEIYKGEKYSCYIWMNRWTEKGLYHGMDVLCERVNSDDDVQNYSYVAMKLC